MNWQPIETAPKDGSDILILTSEYEKRKVTSAYYESEDDTWVPVKLSVHGCGCCRGDYPKPSHWMPLPEPPMQ